MVDRNCRLFFHQDLQRVSQILTGNPVVEPVIRGEAGSQALSDSRGVGMLASFAPVAHTGWGIVAQRPADAQPAGAGWPDAEHPASAPADVAVAGRLWWLSQLISRPPWQLAKSAEQ
ncbi:PDC sensor domain-containing protein [Azotobacter armeniacus]